MSKSASDDTPAMRPAEPATPMPPIPVDTSPPIVAPITTPISSPISLYVHIPFCETKCPYCDFNTYAAIEPLMPSYMAALRAEIALWGRLLGSPPLHTIFFGGGTPSYLPEREIRDAMAAIRAAFPVRADAEITLEANPGDFGGGKLSAYLDCGINRLSIGVQSFDDNLLKTLGRRHNAADAIAAYRQAADAGFDNISIDLMYGLPYQSVEQWQSTLAQAIELAPPHLSMYCLTLEGGTPMERWVEQGSMPTPDGDIAADMYLLAQSEMRKAGYRHYEISNWTQNGKRSMHNLTYWRNEPYLGVGPGAHSYIGGFRFNAIKSPREYIRRMGGDAPPGMRHAGMRRPDTDTPDAIRLDTHKPNMRRPDTDTPDAIRLDTHKPNMRRPDTSKPDKSRTDTHAPDTHKPDTHRPDIGAIITGVPVVDEIERIDADLEMAETMMMGLRLDEGIGIGAFTERFGAPPSHFYADTLAELAALGLLHTQDDALRLTPRGVLLGNEVFSRFF